MMWFSLALTVFVRIAALTSSENTRIVKYADQNFKIGLEGMGWAGKRRSPYRASSAGGQVRTGPKQSDADRVALQ